MQNINKLIIKGYFSKLKGLSDLNLDFDFPPNHWLYLTYGFTPRVTIKMGEEYTKGRLRYESLQNS